VAQTAIALNLTMRTVKNARPMAMVVARRLAAALVIQQVLAAAAAPAIVVILNSRDLML
jgi:hypothetical protein